MRSRNIRNAVAAVVLTAAVAAAGTACGSDSDDSGHGAPEPRAEAPASPTPESADGKPQKKAADKPEESRQPGEPEKKPEQDGAAGDPATVPKPQLTPATGSFTKKQKEYLVDRVPRGTDPAAVLEAGQAVCERISRTAEVDRQAAISALRTGEIADPEAAVTHLCPKHKPLLEAAGLTGG